MIKTLYGVLSLVIVGLVLEKSLSGRTVYPFIPAPPLVNSVDGAEGLAPFYASSVVSDGSSKEVHSAAVAQMSDGGLRAFWYGGSREGAKDVGIYSAVLEDQGRWRQHRRLLMREQTELETKRYIRKLGNPVAVLDSDHVMWLFYVSVSLGGWAGSSINVMKSYDDGNSWSASRRLITSPFTNISTLVKGTPYLLANGALGVPIYHEFIAKFGELLILSRHGDVLTKQRIGWGRDSLQPIVIPKDAQQASLFMRYAGEAPKRVLQSVSVNGGAGWTAPHKTGLPNPDSALAGVRLSGGEILLAINHSETARDSLSLALSKDEGATWQLIYAVEKPQPGNSPAIDRSEKQRFSYPVMMVDRGGLIHLLYSWNRKQIRHVQFNERFVLNQLERL